MGMVGGMVLVGFEGWWLDGVVLCRCWVHGNAAGDTRSRRGTFVSLLYAGLRGELHVSIHRCNQKMQLSLYRLEDDGRSANAACHVIEI
jgi:hypothetical protein